MSLAVTPGWIANTPALDLPGRWRSRFAVAGITVEVSAEEPAAVDLGAQLAQFQHDGDAPADIDLQVDWVPAIEPARGRELFHSGCLWSVFEHGGGFLFDFVTRHLGPRPYKRLLVDREFRRARVELSRECMSDEDAGRALEYPLDELLITHHLSLGRGVELHGCGMAGRGGESFLFTGHSGAGKSTTARLWTRLSPVEVLSDDRIIVRRAGRDRSPGFTMHGTPWHGEAAFASPGRAPLRRIFLLEHGRENRIERLSPAVAVGELLARSFTPFYLSRFVDPVLALLEDIVSELPCYRFQFVPEPSAVEKILEFHD